MVKLTKPNLPLHAYTRPLFFTATRCGVDGYGAVEYEVRMLDFFTCKQNILDMYRIAGCKCDYPKTRMIEACNNWTDLAVCSGYSEPTLT